MIHPSTPYKPRRLAVVTTILLLFVLAVQACAPAATPSPASPTNAPSEVQASSEAPTSPEAPASPTDTQVAAPTQAPEASPTAMETSGGGSVSQSGTLRVAMQPIVQTDPAFISSDSEVLVANHVYDYLVDINPDSEIIPRLAKTWTTSEDGLTYVFELNEGVTFHDGSPFSAADVVWTFDRLRDPTQDLPTKDLYANIDSIEATGDLEVTFILKQPNPFFLYDLSDNHALILKADTQDPTDFNGTGPFVVQNYSPEDRISMVANENYFVEGEPMLAGLDIIFFNDEAASVDALRSGQVDLAMRMSISLYQSLQGDPNITTIDIPTNGFDLVRLRSDRAPGNDPKVMQAFKLATDRQAIFQLVQQGFGAIGSDTPIGPLYKEYYDPAFQPPARDVEAARQLLTDAGYPNGLDIDMHVPDTGGRPDLAVVLKNQWAEAGINVNVIVEPESVYYGDKGWLEVDLGITGWGSRPYPQFYLDTMLTCNAIWNEAHFCDPEFDQLAMTAGTTLDDQARKDAYDQIQQLLVDRGPIIIPYFFAQVAAINNNFQNFELKAFAGRTDFRQVSTTP